jgi:hypothetical protein
MNQDIVSFKEIIRTASRQVAREHKKVQRQMDKMRDIAGKIKSLATKWEDLMSDATTSVVTREVKPKAEPIVEKSPTVITRKKRGRPFKNETPIGKDQKQDSDAKIIVDSLKPKKTRGRPRKTALETRA